MYRMDGETLHLMTDLKYKGSTLILTTESQILAVDPNHQERQLLFNKSPQFMVGIS